ncbi:hypothetical protein C8A05DRAFT_20132 [Staphylotrichum tortipilum]|uniref:FAD/NAD(P)-binding domain-containing protein n=1 Tax=Staphylotrichum tortipilum TaxID=2831512 RepID=A0AAN6RNJ0_9PEZI|nr:hypothetical protein C8A05DRAFT_20132 [Staphylotrichum longicolle]
MDVKQLPVRRSDVAIIGAGFSGINIACQLQRKLGVTDYVIYDRASDYGGTWFANRYPGCGVDIPGVFYSLSWAPNAEFSRAFPSQPEILDYLRRVATQQNIPQHIRLRTEWTGAHWDEKACKWRVFLTDLETGAPFIHEAKILVSAVGGYVNPKYPSLPGLEDFQGPVAHTAAWPEHLDLAGKNVVVVGNGCSASQTVPAIIDQVQSVTQFVRSPQYYVPMPNIKIPQLLRQAFSLLPALLLLFRWFFFWLLETSLFQFYNDKSGQRAREWAVKTSRDHVRKTAPEQYWPLLTPSYDLGCRRRILDDRYLKTLSNPKMFLTNDSIASVGKNSVTTMSGKEYPTDVIILATGFEFTQWKSDSIIGRNGVSLQQHWRQFGGIEAYKSVAMSEFPNLFYLLGPNSGSGHTSVLYSIECSTELILKLAQPVLNRRAAAVEADGNAEREWCETIQGALRKTVLTKSCSSHFTDAHTGWNFFSYPFSSLRFWFGTRFPDMSHWTYT